MSERFDFSGWVTKNNLKCSDGRTIKPDAFKHCDGEYVPLIYQHNHMDMAQIAGKVLLKNKPEGVYGYGSFNGTPAGDIGREIVKHGDLVSLSIHANNLDQDDLGNVFHGDIKEVSLVLSGANPGARIEYPSLVHGDEYYQNLDEAIFYNFGGPIELSHAGDVSDSGNDDTSSEDSGEDDSTVQDVYDAMSDEQKEVVKFAFMSGIDAANEDDDDEDDEDNDEVEHSEDSREEDEEMKHNVFDNDERATVLSHSDIETIFADAKRMGSLRDAVEEHKENGVLSHAVPMDGMTGPSTSTADQTYGFRDPDMLFPEYKTMNNPPEWIKRNTDWVTKVMSGAHHTPFSRIKSVFADITEDEARARGYIKGKLKKEEVFTLLKRTTDPQTIYKKQKLDRDDVIDITDFDVVSWIRGEMRIMLDEEIARAILIGDGRLSSSDDKIQEAHVRPIVSDAPLFSVPVSVPAGQTDAETAKNFIDSAIRARKLYKGTGTPTLFTTADLHTEMLLLEDGIGHKLYKSDAELATALRVSEIVEVEPMEGQKVDDKDLFGVIVNMSDYNIGADKGGEINMFDDFDIDYNQMKYLIETRISGALIKPYSALVLTKGETEAAG